MKIRNMTLLLILFAGCPNGSGNSELLVTDQPPTCLEQFEKKPFPTSTAELVADLKEFSICTLNDIRAEKFNIPDCNKESTINDLQLCNLVSGSGKYQCNDVCSPKTGTCHEECLAAWEYHVDAIDGLASMVLSANKISPISYEESADHESFSATISLSGISERIDGNGTFTVGAVFIPDKSVGPFKIADHLTLSTDLTITILHLASGDVRVTAGLSKLSVGGLNVHFDAAETGILNNEHKRIEGPTKDAIETKLPGILNNLLQSKLAELQSKSSLKLPWGCETVDGKANTGRCSIRFVIPANGKDSFETIGQCQSNGNCSRTEGFSCHRSGINFSCDEVTSGAAYGPSSPGLPSYQACKKECPCRTGVDDRVQFGHNCSEMCLMSGKLCSEGPCCGSCNPGPPLCHGPPQCTGPDPDPCCFEASSNSCS